MAKLQIVKASTDVTVYIFIQNSSVTTGAGLTGLVYNSPGLVCYYVRPLAASAALSLASQTVTGAHTDGGFVEVDSTNMPGMYRLDLSDAICATGVNSVIIHLKGATNMAPVSLEIQLTSVNLNDGVRGGLTAIPNAAADAAGGLPISDAGGLDLDTMNSNVSDILTDTGTTLPGTLTTIDGKIDTVDGIVDDILVDTAEIGAAGAGLTEAGGTGDQLTAVPWNANWDAEVQSECTDALNAYDPPTKAELDTAVADVSVDEIQASALADLFNTDSGTDYASAVAGSVVKETADNAGGSALTEAGIADAVWDEARSGHTAGGSFGETMGTVETNIDNCDAPISTVDTVVDGIKTVTDNLPNSGALTDIDTGVNNIEAKLPTNYIMGSSDQTDKDDDIDAILVDTGTTIPEQISGLNNVSSAEVNAACDTALSDYDGPTNAEMEARTLAAASYATAANQTTIEGKIDTADTVVDAIKVVTDNIPDSGALTTIAANITAALADTNELQTDLTNGGRLDLLIDAILADTNALQALFETSFSEVTSKPAAGAALANKLAYLFHAAVNKATFNQSTGVHTLYQSNGTSTLGTRTLSDDGTTQTTTAVT